MFSQEVLQEFCSCFKQQRISVVLTLAASHFPNACSCSFDSIDLHDHFSLPLYFDLSATEGYLNMGGFSHACNGNGIVIHLY